MNIQDDSKRNTDINSDIQEFSAYDISKQHYN